MKTAQPGVDLIKEFEGFRSDAYLCPAGVWTIGYGHTADVKPGDYVSRERGEEMLREDLMYFEAAVSDLITTTLNQNEFDALVSFTYNCGVGALGGSTLRKRLNDGEAKCKVFQEELPKWVKAGSETLPGLVRRRDAEVELACAGHTGDVGKLPEEESYLEQAAWYYASEPHQIAAWRALESLLSEDTLEAFKRAYRNQGSTEKPGKTPEPTKFPLDVEYFYQLDSKTGHGERSCFSSSMAMALEYVNPEKFGDMDDDDYLRIVFKYGDTVSADAQLQAAASLGYDCEFRTNGSEADLLKLLDQGVPIPVGVLHKGSVNAPSGGGHWLCLTGYDETHFWCGDPFGEMDVVNGGYVSNGPDDGNQIRYTRKNLMKRWLIDSSGADGWMMVVKG
jgi:GH24 family phage-related lysozyme (muramidase)